MLELVRLKILLAQEEEWIDLIYVGYWYALLNMFVESIPKVERSRKVGMQKFRLSFIYRVIEVYVR